MNSFEEKVLVIGIDYNIQQVLDYILLDEVDVLYWDDYESISYFWENGMSAYTTIVIAINSRKIADEIYDMLVKVMEVEDNKIIDFYRFYWITMPYMNVDKHMSIPNRSYEGMILGISHAEVGIIPELLGDNFVNLAVSSQDIYYNYKTLEYCVDKYYDKVKNLKYLIIDMFDYTYFNYDVSKSRTIVSYYSYRGFNLDKHNIDDNHNVNYTHETVLQFLFNQEYKHVDTKKLDIWVKLFGNIHERDNYKGYSVSDNIKNRNAIVTDEEVNSNKEDNPIVVKRFKDTITENKDIFVKLLELAYKINPDMKILCILMPRYHKVQEKSKELYLPWKKEFYDIMELIGQKYRIKFIDMKEDDISFRREYYKDVSHLNYLGAIAYSKKLASIIDTI